MSSTNAAVFFILLFLLQNNGCYANCKENDINCQNKGNTLWETVKETAVKASENEMLSYGAKTAAVATAAIVATPVVVAAAGFGAAGIAAGSVAAALTSIGAAGLGLGGKLAIVTGSGFAVKYFSGSAGDSESASEKSVDKEK